MNKKLLRELLYIYAEIKPDIKGRIKEFKKVRKRMQRDELFYELGFCLLTPQSKAITCWESICSIKKNLKKNYKNKEILPYLSGVRFKYKKAEYFIEAQKKWYSIDDNSLYKKLYSCKDASEMREFLVNNVKGLGYKESSHFLRNIGYGKIFAILDRHILKNLKLLGIIKSVPKSITKNLYFAIENKMILFAKKVAIPMSHLDFVLWYKEAGKVFK